MTDPKPHHFDINLTETGIGCSIKMDGVEVRNVRSLKVSAEADSLTLVTLEIFASMDMDGWAGVKFKTSQIAGEKETS